MTRKPGITGLLWIVVAVFAVASAETAPTPAKNARAAQTQAAALPQSSLAHAYGSLWQVGPGYSTTLTLKNQDRQKPLTLNLVLFSSNGQVEQTTRLQLGPNAIKRVELADIVKTGDDAVHGGGLALEFDSSSAGLIGQIAINSTSQ